MVNQNPLAVPESFTSQGTQIEQARAAYDVMTAMKAAKDWHRDEVDCFNRMIAACKRPRVVENAFWAFPRGREEITGPSVYLMRTIAKIWGNCSFGARELHRDTGRRESEMLAWAWDLQSNLRIEETFIVPWVIDLKDGKFKWLTSFRDIRDALSNVAQRKVRTQIQNMLPIDYVEDAVETARAVLEEKDRDEADIRRDVGEELKELQPLGVTMTGVLHRVGRSSWAETTRKDLVGLRIAVRTIKRGDATVAELFPEPAPEMTAASMAERPAGARSVVEHARAASAVEQSEPVRSGAENPPSQTDQALDQAPTEPEPAPDEPPSEPQGPQPTPPGEDPEGSPDEPQRPTEPAPEGSPARTAPGSSPAEQPEPATARSPGSDRPMTINTNNSIFATFTEAGFDPDKDRPIRLRLFSKIIGREVTSATTLSEAEGLLIKNHLLGYRRTGGRGYLREYILDAAGEPAES